MREREYTYYGPVSSLQFRGRRKGVRLVDGARVKLPPADPRVRRLVARKTLVPVTVELDEVTEVTSDAPASPTDSEVDGGESALDVGGEEQFPPSATQPKQGTTKKSKARAKRSTNAKKGKPPASEPSAADPTSDAGGDDVAPEPPEGGSDAPESQPPSEI